MPAARGDLRSWIDAVVADAYGLGRPDYERVLSGFNHRSDPAMPASCLAAFDALRSAGADTFCRQRNPLRRR